MLSAFESALIVAGSILGAMLLLFTLKHVWAPNSRLQHNNLIGWQISFLGTTYAVIIAFMLSDVWANFQAAETNLEVEANSLVNIYREAEALPAPHAAEVQSLAHRYAQVMLDYDFPAMSRGEPDAASNRLTHQIWLQLTSIQPSSALQQTVLSRALADLSTMTEHRRVRQLQSRSTLPGVFWLVLITGGVMTVTYTCLFGVEDMRVHAVQVGGTTFLVALVLVTIADVDQPYRGALRIQPTAFALALKSFNGTD